MALKDHSARSQLGAELQTQILGTEAQAPKTLLDSSWRDFIFAEIWSRPELDLRSRYLITIPSAASADTPTELLEGYLRGALQQACLTVDELRELALHYAVYGGWSAGTVIDEALSRVVAELGLTEAKSQPLRDAPWDPEERLAKGAHEFHKVMTFGGPPPASAYFEAGILNFVFGEMWHREALDERARRWVTLVGVANSSAEVPIRTHIYAAMASGNCTFAEMNEFVLQYAVHCGWPKASFLQGVVFDMANKLKDGLTWDGKPKTE